MEPTIAQLKDYYAATGTDELVELRATRQLTDMAREVLDEELRLRGINDSAVNRVRTETEAKERERAVFRSKFASIPSRFVAYLIDFNGSLFVLVAICVPIDILTARSGSYTTAWICMVSWWGYMLFKDGFNGQSVGKRILRIQVIAKKSGEPCTFSGSLIRNLLHFLGVLDWAFIFGRERQRLGDRGADTYVVRKLAPRQ
jgi:uncharacterized RDD family membrane protein YckC